MASGKSDIKPCNEGMYTVLPLPPQFKVAAESQILYFASIEI
jgi:hypothetical protein